MSALMAFTVGMEEEHFLVDPATRELVPDPPKVFREDCEKVLGDRVTGELMRSQVETATGICDSAQALRNDLRRLRETVSETAARHGMALYSASTHPFSDWESQRVSTGDRYAMLLHDLEGIARRMLICGMHIHVGIEDADARIRMMNHMRWYLPLMLALSTSSPFWKGTPTGAKSYRSSALRILPRTEMPERMSGWREYENIVDSMIAGDHIEDGSKIWWQIRPSARFPTVENRVCDTCTRLDDAVAVGVLWRSIVAWLWDREQAGERMPEHSLALIETNRWAAQRYGTSGVFATPGEGGKTPVREMLGDLITRLEPYAEAWGGLDDLHAAYGILDRGTCADHQLRRHAELAVADSDHADTVRGVVDLVLEETVMGL